ncbi:MAG: PucR family transcriptional regulator [Olsenella sp.]|nr:PucR family transcriptional regulator [Olsenella sp.]
MVTIADVLALPAFKDVHIIAPCEGAGRRSVRNVGILDCPPDLNGYSNYFPGELILTNLGFASGDERLSERSLITLIDRHVAGVAIKTVYDPIITDAVRDESSREGVPVFLYDGAYHEEVAYQALDLIRKDSEVLDKTPQIRQFLRPRSDEEVCSQALSIFGAPGPRVWFVVAEPRGGDSLSLLATISSMQRALDRVAKSLPQVTAATVVRSERRIVCAVSLSQEVDVPRADENDPVLGEVREAITLSGSVLCGSSECLPVSRGDLCLREAMAACDFAARKERRWVRWDDLGEDALSAAARDDALLARAAATMWSRIGAYDEKNGTELAETVRAFVRCGGEVGATAQAMFQHPNTIRYRLKKIKALVGDEELTDRRLLVIASLMSLGAQGRDELAEGIERLDESAR